MGAYIIHFDLDSFIAQAETSGVGDESIYAVQLLETREIHGVPASIASVLVATYQDIGKNVHAARIVVERASLLGDQERITRAVADRATLALDALVARLPGPIARTAIQLCAGLYEDLQRFETMHDLWTWEDARDPRARRLIPALGPVRGGK